MRPVKPFSSCATARTSEFLILNASQVRRHDDFADATGSVDAAFFGFTPVIVDHTSILAAERFGGLEVDEQEDVGLMPLLSHAATSLGIQLLVRAWANDGAALGLSAR
jgi:hypothetical protein